MTLNTEEIRERYRKLALEWDASKDDPKKANRAFKKHHSFYKEIRNLESGRIAIELLREDPAPVVRLLAATHCLPFDPGPSEKVLTELEGGVGTYAVDAKYTLINFRSGTLNLDW
ncbi:DUF2019 domain-containing protein [Sinomonas sp. ASV322]|uniref:DUF2019 domain-containing protein n=1 Tax=Sinomonas sp. ASV322 TaxID=3041920 RepID=UPI0027DBD338|nr:DUF2019 domain-containing protein [Sinomonas sp. ASV322]MDQ4504629.1 DUF2019 domain-containing protein [Sinomonas sp. ASV322]